MSRKRKYKNDICSECKVRNEDSSKKRLYQCKYCERWFCKKHLEPRLAVMKDLKTAIKDVAWRDLVEKEWGKESGHPDYNYTQERMTELKVEKQIIRAKMDAFLDKSTVDRRKNNRIHRTKGEKSDVPSHLKTALIATLIIAIMIGAGILIPMLALTTGSPFVVILGILGFLFLIFLLLSSAKEKN